MMLNIAHGIKRFVRVKAPPHTQHKQSLIILGIRLFLSVIFVFAAISKLGNITEVASTVKQFVYLNEPIAWHIAVGILVIEFVIGILLLIGLWIRYASATLCGLLLLFIAVGDEIECGCFGAISNSKIDVFSMLRNFVFLAGAIILFLSKQHRLSVDGLLAKV